MFLSDVEDSTCLFAPIATGNGEWSVEATSAGRTFLLSRSLEPIEACLEAARLSRSLGRHGPDNFASDPDWLETTSDRD